MRRTALLALVLLNSLIVACAGGPECLEVANAVHDAIEIDGTTITEEQITITDAAAVESQDAAPEDAAPIFQEDLWFVAFETAERGPLVFSVVRDPSSEEWIGPIFSTNEAAAEATTLGIDIPTRPTMDAEGAQEAVDCLDG